MSQKMPPRRVSRSLAFQVLYGQEFVSSPTAADLRRAFMAVPRQAEVRDEGEDMAESDGFAWELVEGVWRATAELDDIIARFARNWRLERVGRVELTLLRLAVYEIVYGGHITPEGAINEAVELAKVYGQKRSSAFINSILDKVMKNEEKRNGNMVEAAEDAEETAVQEIDAVSAEPVVIMHEISEEEAERLMHANRNEIE